MLVNIILIISILLTIVILLQNTNVSLNLSSMSSDAWEITKRWPEKILQNTTIILAVAFIVVAVLLFIKG